MTITNLGATKEEMIYQFIISLNKGGYASGVYAGEVVAKAIGEYDALVNKGIIKEEDPNKELREQFMRMKSQMVMDGAGDFNARMYDVATFPISPESDVMYGEVIKSNTFPTEEVNT